MANGNGKPVYAREPEHRRLHKLAKMERRPPVDQLEVIIDEACERRGLDRETLEPLQPGPDVRHPCPVPA